MSARRISQRGVTLPELLVALLIFAMISSVGVYALRLGIDGREQLLTTDERLREWQLARLIIRQDLAQVAMRPVRDEFGAFQAGPFIGGFGFSGRTPISGETPLLAFVRGGWSNIDATTPRSTLQYVEYVLVEDDFVRRTRTYLDDARDQPARDRVLFENVGEVKLEFLLGETTRGLEWGENWPATGAPSAPPRAIRINFTSEHYGPVEQLFWIGDITGVIQS